MPIPSTRRATEVQERRRKVAEMYLRGMMMSEIAAEFGVNISQISRDLKTIRQEWLASTLVDFNEAKAQELAKINALEAEYWQAWQASKTEHVEARTSKRGETATASIRKVPRDGNPQFLAGVQWCISERCKILGIYEAAKIAVDWRRAAEEQGHNAGELFERLVNEYIRAINGGAA